MYFLEKNWIVGFVDGEGCFTFSIVKHEQMLHGYQVQGEFSISQHKRDIGLLHALKDFFNCGNVKKGKGNVYQYAVKDVKDLLDVIIPFFEQNPLKTCKKDQLPVFKELCIMLKAKEHLTVEGFEKAKELVKLLSSLKKKNG